MNLDKVKLGSVRPGYIHNFTVVESFAFSNLRLYVYDQTHRKLIDGLSTSAGPYHFINRERVTLELYNHPKCEWLFLVDTNSEFNPDCVYHLLSVADPISAPMIVPLFVSEPQNGQLVPMWFDTNANDEYVTVNQIDGGPSTHIQRIQNAGMAMALIHRSVLDKFPQPEPGRGRWFGRDVWRVNGVLQELGEDMTFFHRARLASVPLYGYRGVEVVHWKMRRERVEDVLSSDRPSQGTRGIVLR